MTCRYFLLALLPFLTTTGLPSSAGKPPPELPAGLARLPADPGGGRPLKPGPAIVGYVVWTRSQPAALQIRRPGAVEAVTYRVVPNAALRRFGLPGADLGEFAPGEWVLLAPALDHPSHVVALADRISQSLDRKERVTLSGQDILQYTCRMQTTGEAGPAGAAEEIQYGKDTVLVVRENPIYTFRVPQTPVWVNVGLGRDGGSMLREVLDEASLRRFQAQQRNRTAARLAMKTPSVSPSWQQHIRPFLEANCAGCHRDGGAQSGFSVSGVAQMTRGGRRGPGLVTGKPNESLTYLVMTGERNPKMPPDRDPIPEELALFKKWIEEGARMDR